MFDAQDLRPAIFFDRDGTLNFDDGYTHRPSDLRWIEGAKELINACNYNEVLIFVVTNQSGVARGFYPEEAIKNFHERMSIELRASGAWIDDFAYCPHHPAALIKRYLVDCTCRKPGTGMLQRLVEKWPVDLSKSLMVGDRDTDIECARRFGIPGLKYTSGSIFELVAPILTTMISVK